MELMSMLRSGTEYLPVKIKVEFQRRLPKLVIVGPPDGAIGELAFKVRAAFQQAQIAFPRWHIIVTVTPTEKGLWWREAALPITLAILAEACEVPTEKLVNTLLVGEFDAEGYLRENPTALAAVMAAKQARYANIVLALTAQVPQQVTQGINLLGAVTFREVYEWAKGEQTLLPVAPFMSTPSQSAPLPAHDWADVAGQEEAKQALEEAAIFDQNLLLLGPQGCGATMLAYRLNGIRPPLSLDEALTVAKIHAAAMLSARCAENLWQRPFRAPHHSISATGMLNEIALATNGVLFLDELTEFSREVLELVQHAATAKPPKFLLVAHTETVVPRIAPFVNACIDRTVALKPSPIKFPTSSPAGETSAVMQARVVAARVKNSHNVSMDKNCADAQQVENES